MTDLSRDLAFMQSPDEWPRWPLLPLVRRGMHFNDPDGCAFQFADGRPVIYIGVIYMLPKAEGQTWGEMLSGLKQREFTSFEELAAEYCVD